MVYLALYQKSFGEVVRKDILKLLQDGLQLQGCLGGSRWRGVHCDEETLSMLCSLGKCFS